MGNFNKVLLLGYLTRDAQLKFLPSQMAVAEFGLATNRKYKTASGEDREEVCFVDCTAFGKTGELINQHLSKGDPIFIEGRLKFDSWEEKQGGGKRSKLSVVVDNFQFIGGGDRSGSADKNQPDRSSGYQRPAKKPPTTRDQAISPDEQFKDDDIPF